MGHKVVTIVWFALSLTLVQAMFGSHLLSGDGKIYRYLFKNEHSDELSTVPYCFYDEYGEDGEVLYPGLATTVSGMSRRKYLKMMDNLTLAPIELKLSIEILQIIEVSERDQTMNLLMHVNKLWNDCRLRWTEDLSTAPYIQLMPRKFYKLDVFQPEVRVLEALNPTFNPDTAAEMLVRRNGEVWMIYEFAILASCNIDVHMYPFDIQVCKLSFESTLDEINVKMRHVRNISSGYGKNMLVRFVPNDVWALTILSPIETDRNPCSDGSGKNCLYSGLQYRVILRRLPYYQLTNLLLPAFLIALISSCVFLVPPGAGDKIGFSLSILLSLYMFCQLMYDKMPESGTTVPLLSQYFLFCIALVTTSCVYSTISTVIASAVPRVPRTMRQLVVILAPFLMPDMIQHAHKTTSIQRAEQRNRQKCTDAEEAEGETRVATGAEAETCAELRPNGTEASWKQADCATADFTPSDHFTGFQIQSASAVTWNAVGALFDRLFFLFHLLISLVVFIVYIIKGYLPWIGYTEIRETLSELDVKHMCEQLVNQGAKFDDLPCQASSH